MKISTINISLNSYFNFPEKVSSSFRIFNKVAQFISSSDLHVGLYENKQFYKPEMTLLGLNT